MKKRILSLVLTIAMLLSFGAGIVPDAKAATALPTYSAADDYGSEMFSYYSRNITNGVDTAMTFNEGAGLYMNGVTANYIGTSYLTTGVDPAIGSMITFTAPYDGTITISNGLEGIRNTGLQVDLTNFATCYAMVYSPDWTLLGDYAIPANAEFVATPDITGVEVEAGDVIKFMVGSNTPMNSYVYWIPVISYTASEELHTHNWQAAWASNETHHWHECDDSCYVTENSEKEGYSVHADANKDRVCDTCNAKVALSYSANEDYGSEVFGYYSRNITNGVNTEMIYNEGASLYMNGATANYIGTSYLTTGVDPAIGSMITFTVPYDGVITISNGLEGIRNTGHQVDMTNFAECYAMVYSPDWTNIGDYVIPANAEFVTTPDITDVEVKAGDVIKFMVGSNTPMNSYVYWIPVVTYTDVVHEHVWSKEWASDATHHWHECVSDDCHITEVADKDSYSVHTDANKDRVCDTCNAKVALSYNANEDYGSEVFGYYTRNITNGVVTEMTFNDGAGLYMNGATANYIGTSYLTAGVDPAIGSMITFTAPYDGTITISNGLEGIRNTGHQVDMTTFATCYAMVYSPDWTNIGDYSIPANAEFVATPDITGVEVKAGDVIKFVVGSNTAMNSYIYWIPIITYTEVVHSHVWSAEWTSDATHHWHECDASCYITENSEKEGYAAHADANKDRVCDTCNAKVALSYNANEDYGSEVFGYYTRNITNGVVTEMTFNDGAGLYMNGATANYIGTSYLTAGVDPAIGSMITFTAPYDGTITISNGLEGIRNTGHQVDMTTFAECYAMVYSPDWTNIGDYAIPANAEFVATPDITGVEVKAGDVIKFVVGSNTPMNSYIYWIPIITYTEVVHSHVWSAEWTSDATHHWHECAADDCDITDVANKDGYSVHTDTNKDRTCDACNAKVALSYNANEDYGTDVFGYYSRNITNGVTTEMVFNEGAGLYMNGATANYIGTSYLTTGVDPAIGSMITFTAPYDGVITISNGLEGIRNTGLQVDMTNFADCYAMVYSHDWTLIGDYTIPANAEFVATPDITDVEVKAGDVIKFLVGSNTPMNSYIYWIPVITYTYSSDVEPENPSTYYISSSQGNDSNDGLSEDTAWASLDNLAKVGLFAGDTVLLKSGDTWVGSWELNLSHGTEKNPITFASYGEGNKPSLRYYADAVQEKASGIVLTLNNVNGFVMDGLDIGYANLGVELYYDARHYESDYVRFTNCHFHDIYGVTQLDNNPDIYVSAGITTVLEDKYRFQDEGDDYGNNWALRGLYIDNCTAYDAGTLVCGPSGVFGFYMTDCTVENNGYYGTTVFGCRNGYIDRCVFKNNGTRSMPAGSCGIMISCENFTVKNSIISGQQRQGDDHDGCGIDFEWECHNVLIENCLFQENAGVGIMYFTSGQGAAGTNYNTNVLNCYFINNNQNPDDQGIEYEVFASTYGTSGCTVSGNKYFYSRLNGSKTKAFSYAWANNNWTVSNNTRLNSIPVNLEDQILNADNGARVESYNVSLGDNLNLNFYLDIQDDYKSDAVVTVKVAGEQVASYTANQIVNEDGKYVVTVELAAAQMTEEVTIQIAAGNLEFVDKSYSVRGYADYILDEANGFAEKDRVMVKAMLHYGATAQEYFDVNLDNLANAGYSDAVTEDIPSVEGYSVKTSGSVSGIRFHGASLLFKDKIAVRFYFDVTGTGTYTVNGKALTEKDDLWYVEFADIVPQDLDQIIEVVVSDANGSSFTIFYSPLHYIVRQYNKTENAELKALVQNLYDYYKAAEAYVA